MQILFELMCYLKKPRLEIERGVIGKQALKDLTVIYFVAYSTKTLWLLTVNPWLRNFFQVERSEIATSNASLLEFFLLVVLVYPVMVELIFRYYLRGRKWVTILILSMVLGTAMVELSKHIPFSNVMSKRVTLLLAFFLPILFGALLYIKANKKIEHWFATLFPVLFYFSVLSFAIIHGLNFKISGHVLWILPMLVPFVVSGAALGFARMRWGLWASVSLHMSFNLVTFILDKGFSL